MDRSRMDLRTICCEGVRGPFNFFRTPTMYAVVSLLDPAGRKHQEQKTAPDELGWRLWNPKMNFYLDGQDEAGLRLVLDLMVRSKRGDFSVGNASVPISELRATAERSVFKDGAGLTDLPVWASNGKDNGRVKIHYRIMSKPEVRGRQNKTGRSDGADLAHLVEKARKSLRTTTESRSASEEDSGLVVDTAAGKIDLSHLQVIDNEDLVEIKKLGSGAFGMVYAGKWSGTNVAIKRINMSRFTSQRDRLILESFKEAGILSNLHHPNIVSLYGFALDELEGGNLAIVTELVADGSLRDILHRGDKFLDNHRKLIIAKGAASGMEYLHLKRIVHFDLKCDNLLVDLKDPSLPICKVADFGLSKFKQNSLVSGGVRGTLPWMAPELLKGDGRKVSEKVDVYSFGIVMWEILTGEVPYDGMLEGQILGGIFNNILRPPVPTSCEPKWRELMEKCWESDPQKRPSFSEIAIELHSMLVASHAKAGR